MVKLSALARQQARLQQQKQQPQRQTRQTHARKTFRIARHCIDLLEPLNFQHPALVQQALRFLFATLRQDSSHAGSRLYLAYLLVRCGEAEAAKPYYLAAKKRDKNLKRWPVWAVVSRAVTQPVAALATTPTPKAVSFDNANAPSEVDQLSPEARYEQLVKEVAALLKRVQSWQSFGALTLVSTQLKERQQMLTDVSTRLHRAQHTLNSLSKEQFLLADLTKGLEDITQALQTLADHLALSNTFQELRDEMVEITAELKAALSAGHTENDEGLVSDCEAIAEELDELEKDHDVTALRRYHKPVLLLLGRYQQKFV